MNQTRTIKPGYIYLLRAGNRNRYKIGRAQQGRLKARIADLRGQQAADPIYVLGWIEVRDQSAAETELHRRTAKHRVQHQYEGQAKNKQTEWFDFSDRDLPDLIRVYAEVEEAYRCPSQMIGLEEAPDFVESFGFFKQVWKIQKRPRFFRAKSKYRLEAGERSTRGGRKRKGMSFRARLITVTILIVALGSLYVHQGGRVPSVQTLKQFIQKR